MAQAKARKLQVSNGHYLDFNHLARIIQSMQSNSHDGVSMSFLAEDTGLPFRQVRNRISIGRALGIFTPSSLSLSPFGELVAQYDIFFEAVPTLEYAHYLAAGNYTNLIWFELFNSHLFKQTELTYDRLLEYFRSSLKNSYTEHSLKDHVGKEMRFLLDTYLVQNFRKLDIIHEDSTGHLFMRRRAAIEPKILCASLYDFCIRRRTNLVQIKELVESAGSPAAVFQLEVNTIESLLGNLHDRNWLRYETTHGLDQIRLKPGFDAIEFVRSYYENRDPQQNGTQETTSNG